MIDQNRIDRIKQTVDLVELIRSRGIALTKNGKGYRGLCPFHEEKTPSLSVTPGGEPVALLRLRQGWRYHRVREAL